MKKTAMQLLIEWIDGKAITHESVRLKATELLETEREQIEEAYEKGCDNAHDWHSDPRGGNLTAKQYYKDTYQ